MKSSLRKLRGLASINRRPDLNNTSAAHKPALDLDELAHASQDMLDMRNCYDSLLSASAATANSAYEFSEALQEMGACFLEKTALNDDEESGRVLLMLGRTQFDIQKLVDSYRAHVIQTITNPSESLLRELQIVEEMKRQCDDKRDLYKFLLASQREKGRSRSTNWESFSSQQLQAAKEDYDDEASLFVFRLKSLKQGQFRSLLTQAARHHAAQLSFFRKGVKSLEVVEQYVKVIAEQQHIDYQFSGLEDDYTEDDSDDSCNGTDDGELSFNYGQNYQSQDADSASRNSMELDQVDERNGLTSTAETANENLNRSQNLLSSKGFIVSGSQSAPISVEKKSEPLERIIQINPSSTKKFHTYVLPTPADAKSSNLTGSDKPVSAAWLENKGGWPTQLWHSSPLEPNKFVKDLRVTSPSRLPKAESVLKECNMNSDPIRMPPPLAEGMLLPHSSPADAKRMKRQAFSGPLTKNAGSSKPFFSAMPALPTPQQSVSPKVSPSASPHHHMSSPKRSELHELPRPPTSYSKPGSSSLIRHSAPLVSRGQELHATGRISSIASNKASPLPTPPGVMARSFSIPSTGYRTQVSARDKLYIQNMTEDMSPPSLTLMSQTNIQPALSVSESVSHATYTELSTPYTLNKAMLY